MKERITSHIKTTRIPGILHVIMGITVPFGTMYVPSKLMVESNAAAIAISILAIYFSYGYGQPVYQQ